MPLRQRTKLQTRRKLIAAARRIFASKGYHDTRPQDIVREAGVGYGSFYDNFSDKLDCFLAFGEDASYELAKVVQWHWSPDQDTPEEFLPIMLRVMFDYSLMHPGVLPAILMDFRVLSMEGSGGRMRGMEQIIERVAHWQKSGHATSEFDAKLLGQMITNSVKLGDRLVSDNPDDIDKLVRDITALLVKVLAPANHAKSMKSASAAKSVA